MTELNDLNIYSIRALKLMIINIKKNIMKKQHYPLAIFFCILCSLTIQPKTSLNASINAISFEQIVGDTTNGWLNSDFSPITDPYLLLTKDTISRNSYFGSNWPGGDPTEATWVIYFQSATLNGGTLKAGDEIAIIDEDNDKIVGVGLLTATPSPGNFQQYLIAFSKLSDGTTGYLPGNEFTLKCYDTENMLESEAFEATFHNPYGDAYAPDNNVFPSGFQQYSIVSLSFDAIVCPDDITICADEPFISLDAALPAGGSYSGAGVLDNVFYPNLAGIGIHTITYSYTNPSTGVIYSCNFTITVNPVPIVTCQTDLIICESEAPITLVSAPPDGIYSGAGITGNLFYPSNAGPGTHTITYVYTNEYSCSTSCEFLITVGPAPAVEIEPDIFTICEGSEMDFSGLVISNYYEIIQWFTTNGGGEFIPNDNVPEPVYVPSPSIDFPQGCIQIGVVASPIDPCSVFAEDFMDLCFQPEPQVFAGNDATICLDIDNIEFPLFDANVENELSINWVTSGDGFFENISSVTTTYTLGENDLISGMVELCLQAEPISPCLDIISHCLTLTIAPIPEFDCPEYGPFCAGDDLITFEGEGFYTQDGEIVTTFDPATAGTSSPTPRPTPLAAKPAASLRSW
jgi:hypothetical protein